MEEKKYCCRKNCGCEFPHAGNHCRHEKTCTVNESSEVSESNNIETSEVSEAAKTSSGAVICSNSWCNRSFSKPSNMNIYKLKPFYLLAKNVRKKVVCV